MAALLKHFFADNEEPNFFRGEEVEVVEEDVAKLLGSLTLSRVAGGLKYLIHTSPGEFASGAQSGRSGRKRSPG